MFGVLSANVARNEQDDFLRQRQPYPTQQKHRSYPDIRVVGDHLDEVKIGHRCRELMGSVSQEWPEHFEAPVFEYFTDVHIAVTPEPGDNFLKALPPLSSQFSVAYFGGL